MPGCGSERTHGSSGSNDEEEDSGDGKIYPTPNGQHVSEDAACADLLAAQEARVKALTCSITLRTCPALLRSVFVTQCMEYDDGSVQGCVDLYADQKTCEGLEDMKDNCIVTAYPGTEPKGCPTP